MNRSKDTSPGTPARDSAPDRVGVLFRKLTRPNLLGRVRRRVQRDVRDAWEDSRANHELLKIRYRFDPPRDLRLHLGCGRQRLEGFVNIDHRSTEATDVVCDIRNLPFPDGCASHIESYHVIEHVPHVDVQDMLREWARVLKPGGTIVIECPDFDQTVREYMEGNEERIYNIYGLQRFKGDFHLYGYNPKRLREVLEATGFGDVEFKPPQDYHKDLEPCMRAEARKLG